MPLLRNKTREQRPALECLVHELPRNTGENQITQSKDLSYTRFISSHEKKEDVSPGASRVIMDLALDLSLQWGQ